jgi:D-arabinose 1-dehydrogenase-like Zn-dependent alcohol dehydrogenase
MIAARVYRYGESMKLDQIPIPEPRSTDVLADVKACGIVPNLARVVAISERKPLI